MKNIDKNIPDKITKKATITHDLRNHIMSFAFKSQSSSYLEIGCDTCLTVVSLKDAFKYLTAIDIDHNRISESRRTIEKYCDSDEASKISLICGTSSDIPVSKYDIILIDAAHDYESVKIDFENVLSKNTAEKYIVYFHDYGLVNAGVKKYVQETFDSSEYILCGLQENWNPKGGPIDDWEAVCVFIDQKKRKYEK